MSLSMELMLHTLPHSHNSNILSHRTTASATVRGELENKNWGARKDLSLSVYFIFILSILAFGAWFSLLVLFAWSRFVLSFIDCVVRHSDEEQVVLVPQILLFTSLQCSKAWSWSIASKIFSIFASRYLKIGRLCFCYAFFLKVQSLDKLFIREPTTGSTRYLVSISVVLYSIF